MASIWYNTILHWQVQISHRPDVILAFDRYQEYNIKGATRTLIGTGMIHHLTTATILSTQKVVLTKMENKKTADKHNMWGISEWQRCHQQLQSRTQPADYQRGWPCCNHQETGHSSTRYFHQPWGSWQYHHPADLHGSWAGKECLSVMADDTDVYILLLHYYIQKELNIPMLMESRSRKTNYRHYGNGQGAC